MSMDQGRDKWNVERVNTNFLLLKGKTFRKLSFVREFCIIFSSVEKYMMLNTLWPTRIVWRMTKNDNLAHIHVNIRYSFWSLDYVLELKIIMVTINQWGPMWQIKIVKALAWGQKKNIARTTFCFFHAVNSVLLARLMYLLLIHHQDVIFTAVVLINARLFGGLHYFFQCTILSLWITGLKLQSSCKYVHSAGMALVFLSRFYMKPGSGVIRSVKKGGRVLNWVTSGNMKKKSPTRPPAPPIFSLLICSTIFVLC